MDTDRRPPKQGPTIRLEPAVHNRLKVRSARSGIPVYTLASQAVTRHLDQLDAQEAHADDVA